MAKKSVACEIISKFHTNQTTAIELYGTKQQDMQRSTAIGQHVN
jgi:hypothetical protein